MLVTGSVLLLSVSGVWPLVTSWRCAGWNPCGETGMELLLWEWCLDGVKLREPGCLLPGEAGNWRCDLDLWCRLRPLSWGVVPYSADSSQDLLTSSSWEALRRLLLGCPSSWCRAASVMAHTSSRCRSWNYLTALFMAQSCSLMRASSRTFSLSLVMCWVV